MARSDEKLSLDSFSYVELSGVTHATADTSQKFRHALGTVPRLVFFLEGDVYIPKDGLGPNELDVRSRLSSHPFRLYVAL